MRVSIHKLEGLETTQSQIEELFKEFDPEGTGTVPAYIVRHLMREVRTNTELTDEEVTAIPVLCFSLFVVVRMRKKLLTVNPCGCDQVQDLLVLTGVSTTGTFGRKNDPMRPVDYKRLIKVMTW